MGRIGRIVRGERGFSLPELMVVVLVIAILIAVAIPTYLGVRTRSQDRAAQVTLAEALRVERGYFQGPNHSYTDVPIDLEFLEPGLDYEGEGVDTCAGYADERCVHVELVSSVEVLMIVRSGSGTYWAIRDKGSGAGQGTFYNAGGSDAAPAPADVTDDSW